MTTYLDMDGVLADFAAAATAILGMDPYRYEFMFGTTRMWDEIAKHPNFFAEMPPMPDLGILWDAVRDMPDVRVLTAIPKSIRLREHVRAQKRRWVDYQLGPLPMITCRTRQKPDYAKPGDILIDDRNLNEKDWVARGGVFLHHAWGAEYTVSQLRIGGHL